MRDVLLEKYPDSIDDCPKPESINEEKAKHVAITGDNCNSAQKQKRLINARLGGEAHEVDCQNHLRNTFLCNSVEKALSKYFLGPSLIFG